MKRMWNTRIFLMLIFLINSIRVFSDSGDIPFYILMIKNQIMELSQMSLQMERNLKRFLALTELTGTDVGKMDEELATIVALKQTLLNDTRSLLSSIDPNSKEKSSEKINNIERSLQNMRYLFLRSSISRDKARREARNNQYMKYSNSDSLIIQTQLMNQSLRTLTSQLDTLLEVTQDDSQLHASESSLDYAKDIEAQRMEDEKMESLLRKNSKFRSQQKIQNSIFE